MSNDFKEAKKVLLGQAKALDMEVDGRWSVETLAEKVLEAQEAQSEAETQAIRDESDTWVFMLRDGFAVADEKLRTGGTFLVPDWIAERWFVAGVARPATRQEGLAHQMTATKELDEQRTRNAEYAATHPRTPPTNPRRKLLPPSVKDDD